MANKQQLNILKKGVDVWNKWRDENLDAEIDFGHTDLNGADLIEADFSDADLNGANLSGAELLRTDLSGANLREAKLNNARLHAANLFFADLIYADLSEAYLNYANLREANLNFANLNGVNLSGVNLSESSLNGTNLTNARIGKTIFGDNDLRQTVGLETIRHDSPSIIATSTLQLSKGKLHLNFMRGCGLSDWEIESSKLYSPNLTNEEINKIVYSIYDIRATQAIQISPLFISYSNNDTSFVDSLEKKLNETGIRFWRYINDSTSGRLETQIDRAIRHNPTVLLVLSENSTKSDWVEHEVRLARKLELEIDRDVLCPIALDESWKTCGWPERIMEQVTEYNILDFSEWDNDEIFSKMFSKLVQGLDLFYK
ncbi:toll/interleukin-1 receptor domain-containing protein [Chloroflexota bacterium]